MSNELITGGSLFAGIGGLELGAHVAGLDIDWRWQVELDPWCRRVLAKHFPTTDRSVTDVTEAGVHNLERVDVICGGFPCQDISLAGKGAGLAGERSGLWREMARIIAEVGPRVVVVENVTALVARGLDAVLADLAGLGFDAEWCDLRASDVGAPHKRARIFVVAWRVSDPVGERLRKQQQRAAARRATGGVRDEGQPVAVDVGAVVADTDRGGPQGERRGGLLDGCRGPQLANADSERREGEGFKRSAGARAEGNKLDGSGQELADTKRFGPQGQQQAGAAARAAWRRPSWPPGPDDVQSWRGVHEETECEVRRVLDGFADWLDGGRLDAQEHASPEGAQALGREVRALWFGGRTSGPPRRPRRDEQRPSEHRDAMQELPRRRALGGKEARARLAKAVRSLRRGDFEAVARWALEDAQGLQRAEMLLQALRHDLSLQPSVCAVGYGDLYRRQRLKALGNAVCPQQAAVAWRRVAEVLTDA
jgi:DNA (cytosine-5)-methyltransferase 1